MYVVSLRCVYAKSVMCLMPRTKCGNGECLKSDGLYACILEFVILCKTCTPPPPLEEKFQPAEPLESFLNLCDLAGCVFS